MRYLLIILLSATTIIDLYSQDREQDLFLIEQKVETLEFGMWYKGDGNNKLILKTRSESVLAKYNPLALTLKGSMAAYQHVVSPLLHGYCFYDISCSNFAKHAIHEFGIIKGMAISADRITRCNRISATDLDPVKFDPESKRFIDRPQQYKIEKK